MASAWPRVGHPWGFASEADHSLEQKASHGLIVESTDPFHPREFQAEEALMRPLKQLIETKAPMVSVRPDDTVFQALTLLAKFNIGALPVMEKDRLVGMFSERDYARKIILVGKASKETLVREIMSDKVSCVTLKETVEECMALMTEKHIRHLPVLGASNELLGILSIGDLVKETISEQKFTIDQLVHYIQN
jgi:CBS domain-containing protein